MEFVENPSRPLSAVSSIRQKSQKVKTALRNSEICKSALGRILMCMARVSRQTCK